MKIDFRTIAHEKLDEFCKATESKVPSDACEDQYVGEISKFQKTQKDFEARRRIEDRGGRKCLIMILESPHSDEFRGEIGPAKGPTGRNIRARVTTVLRSINPSDYGLILMNAVQYQCSLGIDTNCVRDQVFLEVWRNGGRKDFGDRLETVVRKGDVVVNCCTTGKNKLRNLVQAEIYDRLCGKGVNLQLLRRTHPSSWRSGSKNLKDEDWKWTPATGG